MAVRGDCADSGAVVAQLERILASQVFQRSARSARFLRYVVERTLDGRAGDLKEYVIALEVFDRPASYDPHVDATVRVEAGKLRSRLLKYYENDGRSDSIRIEIPKGAYVPVFRDPGVPPEPVPKRRWSKQAVFLVTPALAALAVASFAILGPWRKPVTPGPEARVEIQYGDVMRALVSVDGARKGLEHFRRAVALEPKSAVTHAELAYACVRLAETENDARPELLNEAKEEALQAMHLDRKNASAHLTLALAHVFGNWDWAGAEDEMLRAIALGPSDIYARISYARYCLIPHGRFAEALRQYEVALRIDPVSAAATTHVASTYLRMGRSDIAIPLLRRAAEMFPDNPGTLVWLGIAERSEGRNIEAIRQFREALRVSPEFTWAFGHLGFLFGKIGRRAEAEEVIQQMTRLRDVHAIEWDLAAVNAGLGDRQSAFEQLETARRRRSVDLIYLKVDQRFFDLHGDPRFISLARRLNLE